jgi:hypothetical protein
MQEWRCFGGSTFVEEHYLRAHQIEKNREPQGELSQIEGSVILNHPLLHLQSQGHQPRRIIHPEETATETVFCMPDKP